MALNRIVQRILTGMARVKRCLWRRAQWRSQRCQQQYEQWVAQKILARGVARPDCAGAESVLWWRRQFMWLGVVLFFGMSTVLAQPVFVIGESKIASHAALDADQEGFVAGLADSGFEEGRNLRIIRADANGNMEAARRIAKDFLDQKVDLLHTISTPSTLAGLAYQADIPIVFSSVTDPISAGIVVAPVSAQQGVRDIHIGTGGESTGRNLTGVSDLWPVDMQMRLYQRMLPSAQVWGTIYNPAEPNSVRHIQKMRAIAIELGIVLLEATIDDSSQVYSAAQSLLPRVEAFVITSDNTTVNNLDALIDFAKEHQTPVFAGDVDSVRRGAVAAFGMDYFLVGYAAGRKAGLILQGVKPVDIPWGPLAKFSFVINQQAAREQGLDIHPRVLKIADEVLDSDAAFGSGLPALPGGRDGPGASETAS